MIRFSNPFRNMASRDWPQKYETFPPHSALPARKADRKHGSLLPSAVCSEVIRAQASYLGNLAWSWRFSCACAMERAR